MREKLILGSALIAIFSISALAEPQAYSECHVEVNSPPNAGIYLFDEDCKTIYVGPPTLGHAVPKLVSQTPDLMATCGRIAANDLELLNIASANERDSRQLVEDARAGLDISKKLEETAKSRADRLRREQELLEENSRIGEREAGIVEFQFYSDRAKILKDFQRANPYLIVKALPLEATVISINTQEEKDANHGAHEPIVSHRLEPADFKTSLKLPKFYDGIKSQMRLSYFGMCRSGERTDFLAYAVANLTHVYKLGGQIYYRTEALP